ncbi:MAG: phosphoenolpyruvate synthase [Marinilabiliales bacterium]|nr:MAG: phosphoenolpyruvate synthase [Marinilabiliales bacterium]
MQRITILLSLLIPAFIFAQKVDNNHIKTLVERYEKDAKGPYKDIRWFCKDGTTRLPQERCPEPGVQRARYKDEVALLAKTNRIFLGQILATTEFSAFWDEENYQSQLKQYQLQNYLFRTDDGWILRKAQYYRGAFQAEDEEAWGIEFFNWLFTDDAKIKQNFYLLREAAKDIPHQADDNKTQLIRSLSKEISDSVPSFLNIRVKIHGQPEPIDIVSVKKFRESNEARLSSAQLKKMDELINNMEIVYQPANLNALNKYLKNIPKDSDPGISIQTLISNYNSFTTDQKIIELSKTIWVIRDNFTNIKKSEGRLALLDISIKLEEILFRDIIQWENNTLSDLIIKTYYLGMASAGCGYIEMWEWENIRPGLEPPLSPAITLDDLNLRLEISRRMVEWSTGMSRGVYKDVIELYAGFEPLVYGFNDDRIRSSLLLYLGNCVSELGEFIAQEANLSNKVMDIQGQSHIRGINPGYAMGELVVINEVTDETMIYGDKIYVFNHPPADLKPVAGIATVTEGNMVSHVQLLARNLGIPNAVISAENLEELKKYNGNTIFYAVSNKGTVIMKPAEQMTLVEKKLFETKKRSEEKIRVPVNRIDLQQSKILNLRDINASHSGIQCGPKAANLGQLKLMFPEHVVEGIVIPFGIFKQHMDQEIPGKKLSYWDFLNATFKQANEMRQQGKTEDEIDKYTLGELEILRKDIKAMKLMPAFVALLEQSFVSVLGKPTGGIPVFLRSDTNMEDLKDFTGAGLNLTIFNVAEKEKILQGIKDVWASPYTERSYKWRQRYLLNPENVYPSILIIPSVDVDYSGVLITKGILTDNNNDLTVAFSRGAGGAVEGQSAESYLLQDDGENILLSPSREPNYNTLPEIGGLEKKYATFEDPILSMTNLDQIREFSKQINKEMASSANTKSIGPHDIELGFKDDKVWLFQIRPFVENKNATRSAYLLSITPELPAWKPIYLKTSL